MSEQEMAGRTWVEVQPWHCDFCAGPAIIRYRCVGGDVKEDYNKRCCGSCLERLKRLAG